MTNKTENSIKVIACDLDDTLWPNAECIRIANEKSWNFLKQANPNIVSSAESQKRRSPSTAPNIPKKFQHQITQAREYLYQQLLIEAGENKQSAQGIASEAMEVFLDWRHKVICFEGVVDALKHLKKQYALASISNGNARPSRIAELQSLFDFSINAEDVNSSKPEPDLFLACLNHFQCSPHEMIYIGDHLDKDIQAAQDNAIHALWFNPSKIEMPTFVKHQFHHFADLSNAIAQIEQGD